MLLDLLFDFILNAILKVLQNHPVELPNAVSNAVSGLLTYVSFLAPVFNLEFFFDCFLTVISTTLACFFIKGLIKLIRG